jgi:glycosyltransferase involved in cell wall biosynthesis
MAPLAENLNMCVSVIIPTFNRSSQLATAVRSVLRQTQPALEVIVVDDGSTDATGELIESLHFRDDPRFRYVRLEHRGVSHARNIGVSLARHDLIAFLDSDDSWAPNKLALCLPLFEDGCDVVSTDALITIAETGEQFASSRRSTPAEGQILVPLLLNNFIVTSSVIARKSALVAAGLFNSLFESSEDYHLWVRLARWFRFGYVAQPLTYYTYQDKGISSSHVAMNYYRVFLIRLSALHTLTAADRRMVGIRMLRKIPRGLWAIAREHFRRRGKSAEATGDRRAGVRVP